MKAFSLWPLVQQRLILLLFCISPILLFAQEKKEFNFTKYKNEIGILNLERVFNGDLSAFFIYKRRATEPEGAPTNRSKYTRFQLSLSGNQSVAGEEGLFGQDFHNLWFSIGKEWAQHQHHRFTFYYGWDGSLGFFWNENSSTFRLGASPFVGAKFHLSERFHLSLESSFLLAYNFREIETGNGKDNEHRINYGMDYLRFLTLGYYF